MRPLFPVVRPRSSRSVGFSPSAQEKDVRKCLFTFALVVAADTHLSSSPFLSPCCFLLFRRQVEWLPLDRQVKQHLGRLFVFQGELGSLAAFPTLQVTPTSTPMSTRYWSHNAKKKKKLGQSIPPN
ncbi:hypothetical protein Fcan01_19489 [Folsomia candida]|uniref:Uncharacterized protein n=1 Tax=Folsomia candida TaxID=158441 RepID=A0A226DJB8_FOLCA|nr:hypothetical protein Fcan01_19489 [Folsomia candida]